MKIPAFAGMTIKEYGDDEKVCGDDKVIVNVIGSFGFAQDDGLGMLSPQQVRGDNANCARFCLQSTFLSYD